MTPMNTQQPYFWWGEPAAVAAAMQQHFPEAAAQTITLADEYCENRFTFRAHWEMERTNKPVHFPGEIQWDYIPEDDPEWVFAFNRLTVFVVLGQAWRLTGNEKYPAAFARMARHWLDATPFTEQSKTTTWRAIETGIRCENWLRSLALFHNSTALTPALRQDIHQSLQHHAEWLLQAHAPFQRLSNWGVLQNHGLFLLGLALQKPEWCGTAAQRLDEMLHYQVMADGTHWEQSPMYHGEVLHCCLNTLLAAGHSGYTLPGSFVQQTHKMCTALAMWCRPDGLLLCQSDTDEIDARDLLVAGALLFKDPLLKAYAGPQIYPETLWDFGSGSAAEYSQLATGNQLGSTSLAHSGNTMLWDGTGPSAGMLHFRNGCLGSGHGHADLFHINLVCNGESILIDSGRYTYVDTPLRRELKGSAAHNTLLVDGLPFSTPVDSWGYSQLANPIKGECFFTPHADYVSGMHLGYLQQGIVAKRQVLRLGSGLWVVWDVLHATNPEDTHAYTRLFHFGIEGSTTLTQNGATYTGAKCSARIAFPDEDTRLSLSTKPASREYNLLEQTTCLTALQQRTGSCGLAAVIATGATPPDIALEVLPVSLSGTGTAIPPHKAQALGITAQGNSWTVLLCHTEVISHVDLLRAGSCEGYGKVLVFGPDLPQGLCLGW